MICPSPKLWSMLAVGAESGLSPEQIDDLYEHLGHCRPCSEEASTVGIGEIRRYGRVARGGRLPVLPKRSDFVRGLPVMPGQRPPKVRPRKKAPDARLEAEREWLRQQRRPNPDERMRDLERKAALGDADALERLRAMQRRVPDACMVCGAGEQLSQSPDKRGWLCHGHSRLPRTWREKLASGVEADHPCEDDNACDIAAALRAGFEEVAADSLLNSTDCESLERLLDRMGKKGVTLHAPGERSPLGWNEWVEWFHDNTTQCPKCDAYVFTDEGWPDRCGNCWDAIPGEPVDPETFDMDEAEAQEITAEDELDRLEHLESLPPDAWDAEDVDSGPPEENPRNPDEQQRRLARQAALGDAEAAARLAASSQRTRSCARCSAPFPVHPPGYSGGTGYATLEATGEQICYPCSAEVLKRDMCASGLASLYLMRRGSGGHTDPYTWEISDFTGHYKATPIKVARGHMGAFGGGTTRDDAYFWGPDHEPWVCTRRGDMDLCRAKRITRAAARKHGFRFPRGKQNPWVADELGFPEFQQAYVDLFTADGIPYHRCQLDEGQLAAIGDEDPLPQSPAEVEQNLRNLLQLQIADGMATPSPGDSAHFTIGDRRWVENL